MSARSLKVETHAAGLWLKRKPFPGLRIRGQWLGRVGFQPGARVTVRVVGPGQLVIEQDLAASAAESRTGPNPGELGNGRAHPDN